MCSKLSVVFCVVFCFAGTRSLIIPNELPTLLSLIYSNIPTIKKGTDSRLGWGFRLGDRADFQVLVELGPQRNTQPLANQPDNASPSKRDLPQTLRNTLYAQRQREKDQISDSEGGKWLKEWSESMYRPVEAQAVDETLEPKPGLAIGEIDAKSVIPDDSAVTLRALHKAKPSPQKTTTSKPTTPSLDNVDLDDEH